AYSLSLSSHTSHSFYLSFFTATATTDIYTLSLHDALPILLLDLVLLDYLLGGDQLLLRLAVRLGYLRHGDHLLPGPLAFRLRQRSEEHTSELQSLAYLVCRLLLEKKKQTQPTSICVSTATR